MEWAVRIALEARRRVKEQQKRIGAAEFRNTHFSYVMGLEGVEKFVATPDMATKIDIQFYADARDALIKAIVE